MKITNRITFAFASFCLLSLPQALFSQATDINTWSELGGYIYSKPPCCDCTGSDPNGKCDATLADCPTTSSVFYSVDLGLAGFAREFKFVQAAAIPTYTPLVPSMANSTRSFEEVVSFFKQSPTSGQRSFKLQYGQDDIVDDSYKRSVLSVDPQSEAEKIFVADEIRQVLTDTRFTDIDDLSSVYSDLPSDIKAKVPSNAEGFAVRVWFAGDEGTKSGDLYGIPTEDTVGIVIFYNPDGTTDDGRLNIIRQTTHDGTTRKTSEITHHKNGLIWTSKEYSGFATGGTLMREVKITKDGMPAPTALEYKQTREVKEATLNGLGALGTPILVSKTREIYEDIGGLPRMVEKIEGFGTGADQRTTSYGFYDTPTDGDLNGRLKWVQYPDKDFIHYDYSFNSTTSGTITELRPYKDYYWNPSTTSSPTETSCVKRVTTLLPTSSELKIYHPVDAGGSLVQTGHEKTKVTIDGTTQILKEEISDGGGAFLTTYTGYKNSGAHVGKILWREFPDGTAEKYSHAAIGGGERTVTIERGAGSRTSITAGDKQVNTYNENGYLIESRNYILDGGGDVATNYWVANTFDYFDRPTKKTYNGNSNDFEEMEYGCCGLSEMRNRQGIVTEYFKDDMKRTWKTIETRGSEVITSRTGWLDDTEYSDDGLAVIQVVSDGTTTFVTSKRWTHLNGEVLGQQSVNRQASGNPVVKTSYDYTYGGSGGKTVEVTNVLGDESSREYQVDGRLGKISGDAVHDRSYEYGVHATSGGGLWTKETALKDDPLVGGVDSLETSEWTKTYYDRAGRVIEIEYPTNISGSGSDSATREYYSASSSEDAGTRGKLEKTTDPDGVVITTDYDSEGRRSTITETMPGAAGTRTTEFTYGHENDGDIGWSHTQTTKINTKQISKSFQGFYGLDQKTESLSGDTISSRTVPSGAGMLWYSTQTANDGSVQRNYYSYDRLKTTTFWRSTATVPTSAPANITTVGTTGFVSGSSYVYDGLGRMTSATDSRTGVVSYSSFTSAGQARVVTSNNGKTVATTTLDHMGRTLTSTIAESVGGSSTNLASTSQSYHLTGEVKAVWGDQTYARYYGYDQQGRMTTLKTFQDLAHNTEPTSGTAGAATTFWVYNKDRGWLAEKNYAGESGNGPGGAADYTYTAAGRLKKRTWERGVTTDYDYDEGMLTEVDYSDSTLDVTYTYNSFGQILTATQGGNSHTYVYDPSDLVLDTETIKYDTDGNGSSDFTRVLDRHYDTLLRPSGWELETLTPIVENEVGYGYDTAGRLDHVDPAYPSASGLRTNYSYVAESGNLVGTIITPVHLTSNSYETYRDVLTVKENDEIVGSSTIVSKFTYQTNTLGQRTNLTTTGTAFSTAPVYVWDYNDRGELIEANDTSASNRDRAYQYDGIGNRIETIDGLYGDLTGTANYVADATNEYDSVKLNGTNTLNPIYDDDGNMTSGPVPNKLDANSTLVWDGENRLKSVTVGGTTTTYQYDYMGRRIGKKVGTNSALQYIYDGWNLIADYTGKALDKKYTWGLDLSGSIQGAGGVGGLISVKEGSATYYPVYDGNGNVSEYLDSNGVVKAHYEYDAFGNLTDEDPPVGDAAHIEFAHKFSTKYHDRETGLYYYGYRYYDPVTGRWPSRDPIGERGGINLYAMVGNDAVNRWDYLGLIPLPGYQNWSDTTKGCECDLEVKVDKADYTIIPERGATGQKSDVQLDIKFSYKMKDSKSCCCKRIRVLQIVQETTINGTPKDGTNDPVRRSRTTDKKWRIDWGTTPNPPDPPYLDNANNTDGTALGNPATGDAWGDFNDPTATLSVNGRIFNGVSCFICEHDSGTRRFIGCVSWGFKRSGGHDNPKVEAVPNPPKLSCGPPDPGQFKKAIQKWNRVHRNAQITDQWIDGKL